MSLSNPIVVIAGATGGIGRAISTYFVKNGFQVAILGRSIDVLQSFQKELQRSSLDLTASPIVHYSQCDVTDSDSVNKAIKDVVDIVGPPDILINAAGVAEDALLLRCSDDTLQKNINTNLRGPMLLSRAVLMSMIRRKSGCIINIGSVVGSYGNAGQCAYAASKAGLVGFTKSLSKEVGSRGIRVNLICPGYITTPMTEDLQTQQVEKIIQNTSLKRLGTPDDIVEAVKFVSSCTFMTGQVIHVDGGLSL
eukprot:CFRG5131T1